MMHSIRLVLRPDLGTNFVKSINFDSERNILVLRLKNCDVQVVQLITGKEHMSTIIEKITFQNLPDGSDSITSLKWLARMMCYIEGSSKGFVKVRNIEKQGECLMMLSDMQFSDRVQTISYSEARNILFLASRDGKFYSLKLPKRWRNEWVDKSEREILIKSRE